MCELRDTFSQISNVKKKKKRKEEHLIDLLNKIMKFGVKKVKLMFILYAYVAILNR